jgi:hypothetical protein
MARTKITPLRSSGRPLLLRSDAKRRSRAPAAAHWVSGEFVPPPPAAPEAAAAPAAPAAPPLPEQEPPSYEEAMRGMLALAAGPADLDLAPPPPYSAHHESPAGRSRGSAATSEFNAEMDEEDADVDAPPLFVDRPRMRRPPTPLKFAFLGPRPEGQQKQQQEDEESKGERDFPFMPPRPAHGKHLARRRRVREPAEPREFQPEGAAKRSAVDRGLPAPVAVRAPLACAAPPAEALFPPRPAAPSPSAQDIAAAALANIGVSLRAQALELRRALEEILKLSGAQPRATEPPAHAPRSPSLPLPPRRALLAEARPFALACRFYSLSCARAPLAPCSNEGPH